VTGVGRGESETDWDDVDGGSWFQTHKLNPHTENQLDPLRRLATIHQRHTQTDRGTNRHTTSRISGTVTTVC